MKTTLKDNKMRKTGITGGTSQIYACSKGIGSAANNIEMNTAKRAVKSFLSILLTAALIFTCSCPSLTQEAHAANFKDINDHWAATYIRSASTLGIINGYKDGTFKPDEPVTRAEFVTMINNTLGNTMTVSNNFNDVRNGIWYFNDVCKAVAAGYVSGYGDGTFLPNQPVTREDAAVIISRIVPTYGYSTKKMDAYADYKQINSWATDAWSKMIAKSYFGPYDDGRLHPQDRLTRGQAAKIVCILAGNETIVEATEKVDDSGTKFKDKIFSNGITVLDDVGNGNVTVENCVVLGKFTLNGGGTNTITVKNSRVANGVFDRDNSAMRVLLTGETFINKASAYENVTIETQKLTGGVYYGCGINNLYVEDDAQVILNGSFQTVNINGDNSDTTLSTGTIENLVVTTTGDESDITISDSTKCNASTVNAPCHFHGGGTIKSMNVNARNVTYETRPTSWTIGSNGGVPTLEESGLTVKFSPKNGASSVAINSDITLTFSSPIFNKSGKKMSTSDIEDALQFRQKSKSGSEVAYKATISSSKKVITLAPDKNLSQDTKYYVILKDNRFFGADEEELDGTTCYFTTGDTDDMGISFNPDDDDDGVKVTIKPTITFDDAIETKAGKEISDSYLESAIDFRKTNSSGATVGFTASINSSDKKITITPDSNLDEKMDYYLAITEDQFRYKNDESDVEACSVTWSTSYDKPAISSLSATATESTVTVKATPSMTGTVYIAVTTGSPTSADYKSTSGTAGTAVSMDFTGLTSGTSYKVSAYEVANTYTSSVRSTTVSTSTEKALLSGIDITGEDGNGNSNTPINYTSSDFSQDKTTYSVSMPFGTETAYVKPTGADGATVKYKVNSSYVDVEDDILVDISSATARTAVEAYITAEVSGKTTSTYKINFYVKGNPGLDRISVDGDTIIHSNTTGSADRIFDVSAGILAVSIEADDSEAIIVCDNLDNTSGGTGSLTGDITISSDDSPKTLIITITSNGESKSYVYTIDCN